MENENKHNEGYLLFHARRYELLLKLIHRYHADGGNILDVGRSPFSKIAQESLHTDIDTLGFEEDKPTETGYNYHFDLNDTQTREQWRDDLPSYDTIIFSEVIEHLRTAPSLVLPFFRHILKPGGILIIQTPNAVALHKRIKMIFGWNPYHLIAENTGNPGHFREYTRQELMAYCRGADFKIEEVSIQNYFDYRYRDHGYGKPKKVKINAVVNKIYDILPPSLRPGLCFVVRNTSSD